MSTSGTVGTTRISTHKLLEKALRRCGKTPQVMTPEVVETALDSLFMLLTSLSNRGLNLWCVDRKLLPLHAGQATYLLPVGTQDVLNLSHSLPMATDTGKVVRFGVKFSDAVESFTLRGTKDGLTWVDLITLATTSPPGDYQWYDLDPWVEYLDYDILSLGTLESLVLSSNNREVPMTPLNRDDYSALPNKQATAQRTYNYFFEKTLNPTITLWPVPSDDTGCLVLYRYRQIEDVGSLRQEVELPSRWFEAISWHWAARLAFELPDVDKDLRASVLQMAQSMTIEVEGGETDGAPVYLAPNISVYTR